MKVRQLLPLFAITAAGMLLANTALAHGPDGHGHQVKPKPATCKQAADTENFDVDLDDPQVKALVKRCSTQTKKQSADH